MERFKTKTVAITGAGSGFGRGLALDFAKLGWKVAVSDINMDRAEESVRLVNEAGGQGITIKCDVTKPEEVQSLADTVISKWGTVDIIINNAGVPVLGFMEKISLEGWRFEIDVMLMSVIYGCRTFIPIFKKQGWGHIVNTASSAGIVSLPEMSPYNVTKAGVISLSETLRGELKRNNIGVTVVCPTFFKTNLMDQAQCTDEHQFKMAEAFFCKLSFGTVESVCASTLKAIKKNKLYVFPQPDSKLFWFMKRMAPNTYYNGNAFLYSRGILDKILGI
ncbi:MAG: short chain dehydrogenase [Deltaproteobacteria bacterium HGW-Deltaproteobacteria-2]|jgi:NAD(P)-dependent dehydrogenase (short-subunit alcohol dehydrogenase family)|nr:MAG: short chain dehydrogenase [Deltaproteobacteria bacterium HGW-Deltaproteobacteria-2]